MWRLLSVVVVLLAAAVGYYGGYLTASAQSKLVTPDEINTVEVARRASRAVVTVEAKIAPERLRQGEDENIISSGFFVRPNVVVTNYHAVSDDIVKVTVELYDGRRVPAVISAIDDGADIALLKVSGVTAPGVLAFGSSRDLIGGQKLIVIGSPSGKKNTISTGVMSSLNRVDPPEDGIGTEIPPMILTDANIQPGNSGGPVLDSRGNVIGVVDANLANAVGTGGLLGLAIPADFVKESVSDLEKYGVSQRGQLGVDLKDLADLDTYTRRLAGISSDQGAMVEDVEPGSPAAKAGLRGATRDRDGKLVDIGDIIIKVGDTAVKDRFDVIQAVSRRRPGDTVALTLWRNNKPVPVKVTLTARNR